MEIYNNLSTKASREFKELLNNQLSKTKVEENKIVNGQVTKVTEKFCFIYIPGLKSEPALDLNELKSLGLIDKAKPNETIEVWLERIEDASGEAVVSISKAKKIRGWEVLVKKFENNEIIECKIVSKIKGGCVVEHIDTGMHCFMPGSQIDNRPLKEINHLLNQKINVKVLSVDKIRGNVIVSRKEVLDTNKKIDKAKILEKYTVGQIVDGIVKATSSFGVFFELDSQIDCLCHIMEVSWSRVNDTSEIFTVGESHKLKIISIDKEKQQIGVSIRALSQNPWEKISQYKVGSNYKVKIVKLIDYGAFCELIDAPGVGCLLHSSELSYAKKNPSAKKMFKVGQEITCKITEIEKEKQRISLSYKQTMENPWKSFENEHPVGSEIEGTVTNTNEYAIFLKAENSDIDIFLHQNDLDWSKSGEEEISKYKKGDKIKVKIVEIDIEKQKIRASKKMLMNDPFSFFKDKKVNDIISIKVKSSDKKGLLVRPIECELDFFIKKNQIAVLPEDSRPERFVGGETIDCAIESLDINHRKVSLSIKLLESLKNAEALDKFGSVSSGKHLPFSKLSEQIKEKKDKE
tara:strand:- start:7430 stop:9157 length:1728 start_codon:yes stop_codon:yes gene_type:complete